MTADSTQVVQSGRSTNSEYFLQAPPGFIREPSDIHSDVSLQMFRHEREIREFQWRGGENFFDGKHDDFCFVCGSTMELFGCQTCENCYHAECMSPTLGPRDVPDFWFCPHCVDRDWHIPPMPSPSTYFTPISPPTPRPQSPDVTSNTRLKSRNTEVESQSNSALPATKRHVGPNKGPGENKRGRTAADSAKSMGNEQSTTVRLSVPESHGYSEKPQRPKRSSSPPRKKSKYSAFSSEVDKALSVIHSELEKVGQVGKSEGHLQDKIKDLELRLRVKDNEIVLSSRELALSRKNLAVEHCQSERLQSENTQYKEEVVKLREALETKDAELRDWRAKLRSMMGNDLG